MAGRSGLPSCRHPIRTTMSAGSWRRLLAESRRSSRPTTGREPVAATAIRPPADLPALRRGAGAGRLPHEKIGSRPVLHYRLPQAHVSEPGWSIVPTGTAGWRSSAWPATATGCRRWARLGSPSAEPTRPGRSSWARSRSTADARYGVPAVSRASSSGRHEPQLVPAFRQSAEAAGAAGTALGERRQDRALPDPEAGADQRPRIRAGAAVPARSAVASCGARRSAAKALAIAARSGAARSDEQAARQPAACQAHAAEHPATASRNSSHSPPAPTIDGPRPASRRGGRRRRAGFVARPDAVPPASGTAAGRIGPRAEGKPRQTGWKRRSRTGGTALNSGWPEIGSVTVPRGRRSWPRLAVRPFQCNGANAGRGARRRSPARPARRCRPRW